MPPKKSRRRIHERPGADRSVTQQGVTTIGNERPPADDLAGSCRLDPGLMLISEMPIVRFCRLKASVWT